MPTRVELDHSEFTTVTCSADPDDEWDADDTYTEHYVGEEVRKSDQYGILASLDLENEKEYWLVYVTYSTGDSFHIADNDCLEFIDMYETEADAMNASKEIETQNNGGYTLANGEFLKRNFYPWDGYFESFNNVHVQKVKYFDKSFDST